MCNTLRKDGKLATMDSKAPLTDSEDSPSLSSPPPHGLEFLRPVFLAPNGDVIVPIDSHEEQRRCLAGLAQVDVPIAKGKGTWRLNMNPLKIFESAEAKITDGRYDRIIEPKLEANEHGYPRLAAFLVSDVDYNMFRGFGKLHALSLLNKQAELTELEEQLEDLDREDAKVRETKWKLHSHINTPDADNGARKAIVDSIDIKLKEYDDLLLRFSKLQALRKPSKRLHRGLFNYMFNRHPVTPKDERFIFQKDDFVMVTQRSESNWLDDLFQNLIDYDGTNILKRICITPEDRRRTKDPHIHYFSRARFGTFMNTITAFLSTFLLLIPVYVLITVPMNMQKMATVVLVFVFLCAAALSTFTEARRFDIFISTATYSAVLMVFLGNYMQQNLTVHSA